MKRIVFPALGASALLLVVGCFLFPARSDFYIDNRSSRAITVAWTTVDDEQKTQAIPLGTRALIATQSMIETNVVPPSYVFKRLSASIDGVTAYTQDPIADDRWQRTDGDGSQSFIFDLVLADADLSMP